MNLEQDIVQIIEQILIEDEKLFLVDVLLKGGVGNQKLLVIIDGDDGVSIENCGKVSRKLGREIEERNLIDTKYLLEVSSAGLDHPIKLDRQYEKNLGRKVQVKLSDGGELEGKLISTQADSIEIETKGGPRGIEKECIKQTKILVEFN